MTNPRFTQFEIPADNPEELAKFYRELFGWQIERVPVREFDYWFCKTGTGPGIDGAIVGKLTPNQSMMNYVNVTDMPARIAKVLSLGGQVVVPCSAVAGMGWYALLCDPEGNMFGFWENDKQAE